MTNSLLDRAARPLRRLHRGLRSVLVTPRIRPEILATPGGPQSMPDATAVVTCRAGAEAGLARLDSRLCRAEDLESVSFRDWAARLGEPHRLHRKLWEFCYLCQALSERGMLQPGRRGLGFAVGQESLPALFASLGCRIMASDLAPDDDRAQGWARTGQWADSLASLNQRGLCPADQFAARVQFQPVDMNNIPADLCRGEFDFTWSSCSFEHCGSIALGSAFVERQMACLRPGGVAVHTTEFNLSSNQGTVFSGPTVIYRRADIEQLVSRLIAEGHHVEPLNLDLGNHPLAHHVDERPYSSDRHVRLALYGYAVTSIGLIIRKAG